MKQRKRFYLTGVLCVLFLSGAVCKKDAPDPGTPLLENAVKLSQEKDPSSILRYYTKGTLRAAEEYGKLTGGTDILSGLDRKIFVPGAKWNVLREDKDGTDARVVILITEHPAKNMKGYEAALDLSFEDGQWKL
ncbi:MAG: hypothetical protein ACRCUT_06390, partial [Spirochaetota bacterium]